MVAIHTGLPGEVLQELSIHCAVVTDSPKTRDHLEHHRVHVHLVRAADGLFHQVSGVRSYSSTKFPLFNGRRHYADVLFWLEKADKIPCSPQADGLKEQAEASDAIRLALRDGFHNGFPKCDPSLKKRDTKEADERAEVVEAVVYRGAGEAPTVSGRQASHSPKLHRFLVADRMCCIVSTRHSEGLLGAYLRQGLYGTNAGQTDCHVRFGILRRASRTWSARYRTRAAGRHLAPCYGHDASAHGSWSSQGAYIGQLVSLGSAGCLLFNIRKPFVNHDY